MVLSVIWVKFTCSNDFTSIAKVICGHMWLVIIWATENHSFMFMFRSPRRRIQNYTILHDVKAMLWTCLMAFHIRKQNIDHSNWTDWTPLWQQAPSSYIKRQSLLCSDATRLIHHLKVLHIKPTTLNILHDTAEILWKTTGQCCWLGTTSKPPYCDPREQDYNNNQPSCT